MSTQPGSEATRPESPPDLTYLIYVALDLQIAGPLIAAITGTGVRSMAMFSARALLWSSSARLSAETGPDKSMPAQKTVPAPVNTIARTSSSAAFSKVVQSLSISSALSACDVLAVAARSSSPADLDSYRSSDPFPATGDARCHYQRARPHRCPNPHSSNRRQRIHTCQPSPWAPEPFADEPGRGGSERAPGCAPTAKEDERLCSFDGLSEKSLSSSTGLGCATWAFIRRALWSAAP